MATEPNMSKKINYFIFGVASYWYGNIKRSHIIYPLENLQEKQGKHSTCSSIKSKSKEHHCKRQISTSNSQCIYILAFTWRLINCWNWSSWCIQQTVHLQNRVMDVKKKRKNIRWQIQFFFSSNFASPSHFF